MNWLPLGSPSSISKAFRRAAGENKVTDRYKVMIQLLTFSVGIVGLSEHQGLSMTHLKVLNVWYCH